MMPKLTRSYSTENANNIPHFKVKHCFFKNTFFLSVINEWNKLDPEVQNTPSLSFFKNNILKFIRPTANNIFSCHNLKRIKYLARLRLGLGHLYEHKFKNDFQDTLNHFVLVAATMKIHITFSSTVPISSLKETLFLTKLLILIAIFKSR